MQGVTQGADTDAGQQLLAQKGGAAAWTFEMAYTPAAGGDRDGASVENISRRKVLTFPPRGREAAPAPESVPMPRAMRHGAGRVIVLGPEKGGAGRSTTAMHLIVALLRDGHSVASIDLDAGQRTLSRYLDNRRVFAERKGLDLPMPARHEIDPDDELVRLGETLSRLAAEYDYVVVDAPRADALAGLDRRVDYREPRGLGERVIYRELFLSGLTLLDLREAAPDIALAMSHLAARQELWSLLDDIGLPRDGSGHALPPASERKVA